MISLYSVWDVSRVSKHQAVAACALLLALFPVYLIAERLQEQAYIGG
jgi:hypothetical protein